MKKLVFISLVTILFLAALVACSGTVETPSSATTVTTTSEQETEEISLSFPEEFIIRLDGPGAQPFTYERNFRVMYSGMHGSLSALVSREEFEEWTRNDPEWQRGPTAAPLEPLQYRFIKHFDISFEDVRQVAVDMYLFAQRLDINLADEEDEMPNPYMLFTFDVERIRDYFSIDPARHTSARLWLEEWLQENEPYESYSAFRVANP